jgi:endonuclease G, mitochondrial
MAQDLEKSGRLPDGLLPHPEARLSPSKPGTPEKKPDEPQPAFGVPPPDNLAQEQEQESGDWQNLVEAFRKNRRRLLSLPGVTAIDIGYRIRGGFFQNELALRVHVERKLHDSYFKRGSNQYISKSEDDKSQKRKPVEFFGSDKEKCVPIDVIEAGYQPAAPLPRPASMVEIPIDRDKINRRRRIDPLVGGISIGSPLASTGTLGALVWDRTDGSICILSNWHVLAGDTHLEPGHPCLQPGPLDRGRASDIVARLKRWSFDNRTDAAIAELVGTRHYCAGEILGLPQPIYETIDPYLGMVLHKSGRSTNCNEGFIDGLFFSSAIQYGGVPHIFEDQIHIAPIKPYTRISEPGDSGSVWVDQETGAAVGLHFAGDLLRSAFGEYAVANPMTLVEEILEISFRPVFLEIRDPDVLSLSPTSRIEFGSGRPTKSVDGLTSTGPEVGDDIPINPGGTT